MVKSLTSHQPLLAITLKVTAIGLFTIMSGLIKEITQTVPTGQAVFFRSFFVLPVILVVAIYQTDCAPKARCFIFGVA